MNITQVTTMITTTTMKLKKTAKRKTRLMTMRWNKKKCLWMRMNRQDTTNENGVDHDGVDVFQNQPDMVIGNVKEDVQTFNDRFLPHYIVWCKRDDYMRAAEAKLFPNTYIETQEVAPRVMMS